MSTDTTRDSTQEAPTYWGATYSTEPHNFGEITAIFPVDADWDGYRFFGYCRPTPEEVAASIPRTEGN